MDKEIFFLFDPHRDYAEINYLFEPTFDVPAPTPTYVESEPTQFPHALRGAHAIFNYRPKEGDVQLQVPSSGTLWVSNTPYAPPHIIVHSGGKKLDIGYGEREGMSGWVPRVQFIKGGYHPPDAPLLIPSSPHIAGLQPRAITLFEDEDLHVTDGPISQAMMERMRFRHGEASPFEHGAMHIRFFARVYPQGREVFHEIAVPRIWGSSAAERMITMDYYQEMCEGLERGWKHSAFPDRRASQVMALEAVDRLFARHVMWEITEL